MVNGRQIHSFQRRWWQRKNGIEDSRVYCIMLVQMCSLTESSGETLRGLLDVTKGVAIMLTVDAIHVV